MAKKDTYYFSHDCNARRDEKIIALRIKYKWEGYGLFWGIIEHLREAENYECVRDYNIIAYDLRVGAEIIKSIVEDFGLFSFTEDGKRFYSERLKEDMKVKDEISEKARRSVQARWKTSIENQEHSTTVIRPNYDRNTTVILKEENKRKENNNISPIPNGTGDSTPARKKRGEEKSPKDEKKQYAEFVHLLEKEYDSLVKEFGEEDANRLVEILNNYKGANGKSYKSDYLAIRNWVISRLEEEKRRDNGQQKSIRSPRGPNEGTGGGGYTSTI